MVNKSRQAGAENNLDEMLRALREATINLYQSPLMQTHGGDSQIG